MIRDLSGGLAALIAALTGRPLPRGSIDDSFEGFWRSFTAVLTLVPLVYVLSLSEGASRGRAPDLALNFLQLGLEWFGYPLVLIALVRGLAMTQFYATFVAAYNWTSFWVSLPFALTGLLHIGGIVSAEAAPFLFLLSSALSFFVRFRLAQAIFGSALIAALTIVLDVGLSIVVTLALQGA